MYNTKMYEVVIRAQKQCISTLYSEEVAAYMQAYESIDIGASASAEQKLRQKLLRVYIRECIKIAENAKQKKMIQDMCNKLACAVVAPDESIHSTDRYSALYRRVCAVNELMKQKEKTKKKL